MTLIVTLIGVGPRHLYLPTATVAHSLPLHIRLVTGIRGRAALRHMDDRSSMALAMVIVVRMLRECMPHTPMAQWSALMQTVV